MLSSFPVEKKRKDGSLPECTTDRGFKPFMLSSITALSIGPVRKVGTTRILFAQHFPGVQLSSSGSRRLSSQGTRQDNRVFLLYQRYLSSGCYYSLPWSLQRNKKVLQEINLTLYIANLGIKFRNSTQTTLVLVLAES